MPNLRNEGVDYMESRWGMALLFSYESKKRSVKMVYGAQREKRSEKELSSLSPAKTLSTGAPHGVISDTPRDSARWFTVFLWIWLIVFLIYLGIAIYFLGTDEIPLLSTRISSSQIQPVEYAGKTWENSLGMKFVRVGDTLFSLHPINRGTLQKYGSKKRIFSDTDSEHYGQYIPARRITWNEAVEFCRWLTLRERKAGLLTNTQFYRLPKSAEWNHLEGLHQSKKSIFSFISYREMPAFGTVSEWCFDSCPTSVNAHLIRKSSKTDTYGVDGAGLSDRAASDRGFRCVLVDVSL
jgi:hypothetical protein